MTQQSLIEGRSLPDPKPDRGRALVEVARHHENIALHFERLALAVDDDEAYGALVDLFIATDAHRRGPRERALEAFGELLDADRHAALLAAVDAGLRPESAIPEATRSLFTAGVTSPAPLVLRPTAAAEPPPAPAPAAAPIPSEPHDPVVAAGRGRRHRALIAAAAAVALVAAGGAVTWATRGGDDPTAAPATTAAPAPRGSSSTSSTTSTSTTTMVTVTTAPAVTAAPPGATAAAVAAVRAMTAGLAAPQASWDADRFSPSSPNRAQIDQARARLAAQGTSIVTELGPVGVASSRATPDGASVTLTVRHEGISLERAGHATRLADPGLLRFEATVTRVGDRWVVTSLAAPAT